MVALICNVKRHTEGFHPLPATNTASLQFKKRLQSQAVCPVLPPEAQASNSLPTDFSVLKPNILDTLNSILFLVHLPTPALFANSRHGEKGGFNSLAPTMVPTGTLTPSICSGTQWKAKQCAYQHVYTGPQKRSSKRIFSVICCCYHLY